MNEWCLEIPNLPLLFLWLTLTRRKQVLKWIDADRSFLSVWTLMYTVCSHISFIGSFRESIITEIFFLNTDYINIRMRTIYKIYSTSTFDRGFTFLMPLRVYGHIRPAIQFLLQYQSTTTTPAKPKQLLLFTFHLPHLLHKPMRDSLCLLYEPLSTWHTIPFTSPDLSSSLCLACSREGHKSPLTAGQTPWEQRVRRKLEGHIQARSQIVSWAWLFSVML